MTKQAALAMPSADLDSAHDEPTLPQHELVAYHVAVAFLCAVRESRIRDTKLRDEAMRSAKSVCLNVAEGAGRYSRADKARAFSIARGEAVEASAALEIAAMCGDADAEASARAARLAARLIALLTGLARRR